MMRTANPHVNAENRELALAQSSYSMPLSPTPSETVYLPNPNTPRVSPIPPMSGRRALSLTRSRLPGVLSLSSLPLSLRPPKTFLLDLQKVIIGPKMSALFDEV